MIDTKQSPVGGQYISDEPLGVTWRQHLVTLLHLGAEIEHSLMVQYLYAAYSLGGDKFPAQHRPIIEKWRNTLLAVAREEMGHLLSVQNLLTFLGAPANLTREDFPWDRYVYPFPFALEPFSKLLLCKFIFAEMPSTDKIYESPRQRFAGVQNENDAKTKAQAEEDAATLKRVIAILESSDELKKQKNDAHRVGELYAEIISLISDAKKIPDSAFNEASYEYQASWDDWARAYKPEPKPKNGEQGEGGVDKRADRVNGDDAAKARADAHVIVARVATRQDAITALRAIAAQGEGPFTPDDANLGSHYQRFLRVFQELEELEKATKIESFARQLPFNPTTRKDFAKRGGEKSPILARRDLDRRTSFVDEGIFYNLIMWLTNRFASRSIAAKIKSNVKEPKDSWTGRIIDAPVAAPLARLFNARYTLLLFYISFTYQLTRDEVPGRPSLRALAMHRAFGEMYHLKTIAGMLVRLERRKDGESGCAAPPFEMPYTVQLPLSNRAAWIKLRDLLVGSQEIANGLLSKCEAEGDPDAEEMSRQVESVGGWIYLRSLIKLDEEATHWVDGVIERSND